MKTMYVLLKLVLAALAFTAVIFTLTYGLVLLPGTSGETLRLGYTYLALCPIFMVLVYMLLKKTLPQLSELTKKG